MTFVEFDKYTEEILAKVRKMRDTKGKEYTVSGDDAEATDRFANFNRSAEKIKIDRLKTWFILFDKHYHSLVSYINNEREFSEEGIEGRIVDMVTYLILAGGMIKEDKERAKAKFSPCPRCGELIGNVHVCPITDAELEAKTNSFDSFEKWMCWSCSSQGHFVWNSSPVSTCFRCGMSWSTSRLKWLAAIDLRSSNWGCQRCGFLNIKDHTHCVSCGCNVALPAIGV